MWIRTAAGRGLAVLALAAAGPLAGTGAAMAAAAPSVDAGPGGSNCTGFVAGLTLYSGSSQVTKVGTAFADPLEAELVDTAGCPVPNENVEFVLPATGPSGYFPGNVLTVTVTTDSDGIATAPGITANQVSGSFSATASEGDFQVSYQLTNTTVGAVSALTPIDGNSQKAVVGSNFADPLTVTVSDAYGDPVAGATVDFQIVTTAGAGATFNGGGSAATAQTDQQGQAVSPLLTAGDTVGSFTVTATVSGVTSTATFTLANVAGTPDTITAGVGASQSTELGTDFAVPLAVTVEDANSNPVAGATVTFSAPATGASGMFAGSGTSAKVLTNSDGVATAPDFSANQRVGGYVVTASVDGVATPATFAMVNEPRSTASATGLKGTYWLVTGTGKVLSSGGAAHFGAVGRKPASPVVAMAARPGGGGYWLVTKKGHVYAFGSATTYPASTTGRVGAKPIVGMAATADGKGYWLVASNGAVFAYGDAAYYGSAANVHLAKPIVGMAATPDGKGYWLVASGGGIFSYGDAGYHGSAAKVHLAKPIVGMAATADGKGYWLAAANGAVYGYGDATVYGSGTSLSPKPVVGLVPTPDGAGYWLVSKNGTAAGFGDAGAQGNGKATDVVGGAA